MRVLKKRKILIVLLLLVIIVGCIPFINQMIKSQGVNNSSQNQFNHYESINIVAGLLSDNNGGVEEG